MNPSPYSTGMEIGDFSPGQHVAYIPSHVLLDFEHKDVEYGVVSSKNHINVFVKFDSQIEKLGWNGTTSQSCSPDSLIIVKF